MGPRPKIDHFPVIFRPFRGSQTDGAVCHLPSLLKNNNSQNVLCVPFRCLAQFWRRLLLKLFARQENCKNIPECKQRSDIEASRFLRRLLSS